VHLDLSPKTFRISLVLVTLACCAFFLAQGTTTLLAASIFPTAPASAANASTGPIEPRKGDMPPDFHKILERNIFDPTTGALWPPKTEMAEQTAEPIDSAAPLAPGQLPPACEGSSRMIASIHSDKKPEWSFASLSMGAESPLLYRYGGQFDGKQIDAIYPEAVYLKASNGGLCSLRLFKSGEQTAARSPVTSTPPATEPAPSPLASAASGGSISEAELDQGIRQLGDNKYSVNRALLDKVLANQGEIMRSARVVPHEENGRVIGVKLYGIRRSSILGKLGMQNGDLMRTINGFDMASPDSALEAYSKLRSASNFSVAVTRRGAPVTMDYQVGN
jgi:general secretion pathway protein C